MTPVVLYSGGLDSLTLAAAIIDNPEGFGYRRGTVPTLVHFTATDKHHRHVTRKITSKQLPYLEKLANKKIDFRIFDIAKCGLQVFDAKKPRARAVRMDHTAKYNGHDTGRQVLFLTLAFSIASSLSSDEVYAAFQMDSWRWETIAKDPNEDVSDDAPKFVKAFNNLIQAGGFLPSQRLVTPFLDHKLSKRDIILLGYYLGVTHADAYWCVFSAPKPCGKCCSCLIWKDATKELGFDPVNYRNTGDKNERRYRTSQWRNGLRSLSRVGKS
jgi:7-cyano-7-deazaguanine synthase in queuosine biosynthesis